MPIVVNIFSALFEVAAHIMQPKSCCALGDSILLYFLRQTLFVAFFDYFWNNDIVYKSSKLLHSHIFLTFLHRLSPHIVSQLTSPHIIVQNYPSSFMMPLHVNFEYIIRLLKIGNKVCQSSNTHILDHFSACNFISFHLFVAF